MVLINNVYSLSVTSILYWTIGFPWFFLYLVYCCISLVIYIILATRYICIRQQSLLEKFVKFNRSIGGSQAKSDNKVILNLYWNHFKHLNHQLIKVCKQIKEYDRYCSWFISIAIPYCTCVPGYLLYVNIFVNISLENKFLFYLAIGEINLLLYIVTHCCAGIIKNNQKFVKQNWQFYFYFNRRDGFRQTKMSNAIIVCRF